MSNSSGGTMKHTLSVILLGGLLLLNGAGNWLFAQTEKDGATTVYFTQDLSEKGLKKIYKKALGTRAGETRYKEYVADDYLLNAFDEALDEEAEPVTPSGIEPLIAMLKKQGAEAALPYVSARKPASLGWHEFGHLDCLCYTSRYFDNNTVENCQRLPWFPSQQCRRIGYLLEAYEDVVNEPKTMAVVSALSVGADGAVEGGALQNMMGGNELFSPKGGNIVSVLADIWVQRLTNLDKNTVCLNVLLSTNAEGRQTPLGVVASVDCAMAEQASLDLLNKMQGPLQMEKEQERVALWCTLVRSLVPEIIERAYSSKSREKKLRNLLEFYMTRASETYQLVSLD